MNIGDSVNVLQDDAQEESATLVYVSPVVNAYHTVQWTDGTYGWVTSAEIVE